MRCGICLSLFDANENPVAALSTINAQPAADDNQQPSEPALELSENTIESFPEPETPHYLEAQPEIEPRPGLEPEPEPEPNKHNKDNLSPANRETAGPEDEQQEDEQQEDARSELVPDPQTALPDPVAEVDSETRSEAHAGVRPARLSERPPPVVIPNSITKPTGKADKPVGKPRVKRMTMLVLIIIATLALLLQVLFYTSAQLSLDKRYRPTLETLCGWLNCPIAEWRNLDLIQTEALVIQKHAEIEDALEVNVVITNRAAFPQKFPGLQLQFEDLKGNVVGRRIFRPEQYRTGALANLTTMTPQQAYQIRLDIVAPESNSTSYSLTITN